MLRVREDAIVTAVNRLLAEKGYDLMTVDEVAAEVGIAKASLYKHFSSKEALAGAAMIRVLDRALAHTDGLERDATLRPLARLHATARWTMQVQLAGEMPSLPAQNSALRTALSANRDYLDRLFALSDRLGAWIEAAQDSGALDATLPAEVVLYTLFARACDPVLGVLKAGGQHTDEQIIDWVLRSCFRGLEARPPAEAAQRTSSVGTLQLASTLVATEPMTKLPRAPWPCEPSITRSKPPASAVLPITSAAWPTLWTNCAFTPCFVKKVRIGLNTFSASSS